MLIARLKAGDQQAFETLYNLHKRKLAANLHKLLKSWAEVSDSLFFEFEYWSCFFVHKPLKTEDLAKKEGLIFHKLCSNN